MPEINPLPLPSTTFPNHFSLIILLLRATHSGLLTSLNHSQYTKNPVRRLPSLLSLMFSRKHTCGFKISECVSVNVSMIRRSFLEPTFHMFAVSNMNIIETFNRESVCKGDITCHTPVAVNILHWSIIGGKRLNVCHPAMLIPYVTMKHSVSTQHYIQSKKLHVSAVRKQPSSTVRISETWSLEMAVWYNGNI